MAGIHFSSCGRGQLQGHHLEELVQLHREFGLAVGISAVPDMHVTLDDQAGALVTELLRLALLGQAAARAAQDPGGVFANLAFEADVAWTARFRP